MITAWIIFSSLLFLMYGVVGWQRSTDSFERWYSALMCFMCLVGFAIAGAV